LRTASFVKFEEDAAAGGAGGARGFAEPDVRREYERRA
jgi:hypothetical protein